MIDPVNFAHDVEDVDGYPDEEIPDGGENYKFFKQKVIEAEKEGLPHGEHVDVFVLLGNRVVEFFDHFFVALHEHYEHDESDEALDCSQNTDSGGFVAVEYGGVRGGGYSIRLRGHCLIMSMYDVDVGGMS